MVTAPLLVVAALGGNALLRAGDRSDAATLRARAAAAAAALGPIAREHRLVITHGNGPQVGRLAAQAARDDAPLPLDVLDAETEGLIGYLLLEALAATLPAREFVAMLTRVEVAADDPAFRAAPTKPIGPAVTEAVARDWAARHGWQVGPTARGWQRLVPSPAPLRIVEAPTVARLLADDVVVIATGGGGIPMAATPMTATPMTAAPMTATMGGTTTLGSAAASSPGALRGVEAVVDKDHSSALLAATLGADVLLLLTDVDAVWRDFGTDHATRIGATDATELAGLKLEAGTMAPKVAAATKFVGSGTGRAAIGALDDAASVLAGTVGTQVRAMPREPR